MASKYLKTCSKPWFRDWVTDKNFCKELLKFDLYLGPAAEGHEDPSFNKNPWSKVKMGWKSEHDGVLYTLIFDVMQFYPWIMWWWLSSLLWWLWIFCVRSSVWLWQFLIYCVWLRWFWINFEHWFQWWSGGLVVVVVQVTWALWGWLAFPSVDTLPVSIIPQNDDGNGNLTLQQD